jgi:hypothetical protein
MNWLCAGLAVEEDQVTLLCVTPGIVDSGQQAEVRNERRSSLIAFPRHEDFLTPVQISQICLRSNTSGSQICMLEASYYLQSNQQVLL